MVHRDQAEPHTGPGNVICQTRHEAGRTEQSQTCGSTLPYMFRLWAVHVILASPIVYSLLPGPHRVLEKLQSKSKKKRRGEMIAVFSSLVTLLFLRETYSTEPTAAGWGPLTLFWVCTLIGDSWAERWWRFIVARRLETTCKRGEMDGFIQTVIAETNKNSLLQTHTLIKNIHKAAFVPTVVTYTPNTSKV